MLGSVSFFPIVPGTDVGRTGRARPPKEEGTKERFARWGKEKIRKKMRRLNFFYVQSFFIYMLVPENTDIYGKWFFT